MTQLSLFISIMLKCDHDIALMNAPESTNSSMVISPNSNGRYSIRLRFLSRMVECKYMQLFPSFSVKNFLIELSDLGKLSRKTGFVVLLSRYHLPRTAVTRVVRRGHLLFGLLLGIWIDF